MSPAHTRAAVLVEAGRPFELREVPVPEPGPGEVLVEVAQTNICGSDLHVWRGEMGEFFPGDVVLGHEMAGTVVSAGPGADRDSRGVPLAPGDHVACCYYASCNACPSCAAGNEHHCIAALMFPLRPASEPPYLVGGFAGHYLVTAGQARFRVPEGLTPEIAAGANCALAQVVHGLDVAGLRQGEAVAIQGAGGLGLYAVAVAKARGAGLVIAIDRVDERLELAKNFGADAVVPAHEPDDPRARITAVRGLTGGWGADVVVDVVGHASVIPEGLKMLARGGRYLEMGSIVPRDRVEIDASALLAGNMSLLGVSFYPRHALADALDFLAGGTAPFESLVGATLPLAEIDEAFCAADAQQRGGVAVARVGVDPRLEA